MVSYQAIRDLRPTILNLLFPSPCRTCGGPLDGKARSIICGSCWENIKILNPPFCYKCGRPFPSEKAISCSPEHLCSLCRVTRFYFSRARAAALYERGGVLREAVLLFKHGGKSLGRLLARIMVQEARQKLELDTYNLLIPVPLHPRREREREFNQSLVLARELGRHYRIPVLKRVLRRGKHTPPLSGNWKERAAQIKGAFTLTHAEKVQEKRVLLIDDVFTTGATVNEGSRILLQGGAEEVAVFTLARVP